MLTTLVSRFASDFGLTPVVACEIEFYLPSLSVETTALASIDAAAARLGIDAHPAEKERGLHQYEIALRHHADPARMASDTRRLAEYLTTDLRADFSAKPFPDDYGSALHVHVSLHRPDGRNVFRRVDEQWSDPLRHAVGGLLATIDEGMVCFAPSAASYARYVPGRHAPLTRSWGLNNRTVAIRLPQKPLDDKHLEHRIAGADADPERVIAAVLAGVHHGLTHCLEPGEPIYGDAGHPQYALPPLPTYEQTGACPRRVLAGF